MMPKLIKDILSYGSAMWVNKAASMIVVPVVIGFLSVDELGVFAILSTCQIVAGTVFSFQLQQAVLYWTIRDEDNTHVTFTPLLFSSAIAGCLCLCIHIFSSWIALSLFDDVEFSGVISLFSLFLFLQNVEYFILKFLQAHGFSKRYASLLLVKSLVANGVSLALVIGGLGINGFYLGKVGGTVWSVLLGGGFTFAFWNFRFNRKLLGEMNRYSFPLIFQQLSANLLNLGDRFIILGMLGKVAVGYYFVAYSLGNLLFTSLISPFQTAFTPYALNCYEKGGYEEQASKITSYTTIGLLGLLTCLGIFLEQVLLIMNKSAMLGDAYTLYPFFMIIFCLKMAMEVPRLTFLSTRKNKYSFYYVAMGAIVNVMLNFLMIPYLGLVGAASASLLSFIIIGYLYLRKTQSIKPISYEYGKLVLALLISLIVYVVSIYLSDFDQLAGIIGKVFLIVAYLCSLWGCKILRIDFSQFKN